MKQVLKISLTLTSICLACAFLLALVYSAAEDRIAANQKQLIYDSINQLAPEATTQKEIEINQHNLWELYQQDRFLGYAVIISGQGYGGTIKIMAFLSPDFEKIKGIKIIEDSETPGLGSRIREKNFRRQFENLQIQEIKEAETITGATISSKAVMDILDKKIEGLREK